MLSLLALLLWYTLLFHYEVLCTVCCSSSSQDVFLVYFIVVLYIFIFHNFPFQGAIFLLGVLAVAAAAPAPQGDKVIGILSQDFDQQPDGSYRYR